MDFDALLKKYVYHSIGGRLVVLAVRNYVSVRRFALAGFNSALGNVYEIPYQLFASPGGFSQNGAAGYQLHVQDVAHAPATAFPHQREIRRRD
jgi:hypothetical protein